MPQRAGPGRPRGCRNKVKRAIMEFAQQYSEDAFRRLVHLSKTSKSHAVRVAAIKEIFDRAYGKAPQPLEHSGEVRLTHEQAIEALEKLAKAAAEKEGYDYH